GTVQTAARPCQEIARWILDLDGTMANKLADLGLVEAAPAEPVVLTLGEFLDSFMEKRRAAKRSPRTNREYARRNLQAFFGRDKALKSITVADAKDFER